MFLIDKTLSLPTNSYNRDAGVALKILEMCEDLLNYRGLSYVDYKELPRVNQTSRRFHIKAAYGNRDK